MVSSCAGEWYCKADLQPGKASHTQKCKINKITEHV